MQSISLHIAKPDSSNITQCAFLQPVLSSIPYIQIDLHIIAFAFMITKMNEIGLKCLFVNTIESIQT